MPDSGIWGNPLGFVEEAMQVHSALATCRHHVKRKLQIYFLQFRGHSVIVVVFIHLRAPVTGFFQPQWMSVSVFTLTALLQAAAPKMSGQIIRLLTGNLEQKRVLFKGFLK